jgi:hypothetical protein
VPEVVRAAVHRRRARDRHRPSGGRPRAGIRRVALGADAQSPQADRAVQAAGLRTGGEGIRKVCEAVRQSLRLVSRTSERAARAKIRDPGAARRVWRQSEIALRDSCAGSRVSFRSAKTPRCTRPGHGARATGPATPAAP